MAKKGKKLCFVNVQNTDISDHMCFQDYSNFFQFLISSMYLL